jgi:hypothetical protein
MKHQLQALATRLKRQWVLGSALLLLASLTAPTSLRAQGFASKLDYATDTGPTSLAVGDINSDGRLDAVTANNYDNSVAVLLGTPSGGFGPKTTLAASAGRLLLADVSGDGQLDIIISRFFSVTLLKSLGNGQFAAPATYSVGMGVERSVAAGDVNGDGKQDLVTADNDATTLSVLLGTGGGAFGPRATYGVPYSPQSVVLYDANQDGRLDIIVATDNQKLFMLLGLSTGGFGTASLLASLPATQLLLVDVTGDGRLDLVLPSGAALAVLPGLATGGFGAALVYSTQVALERVALGDVTGDGLQDIVTYPSARFPTPSLTTTVTVLPALATGGYGLAASYPVGNIPADIVLGDVNQDGHLDILAANAGSNSVSVLRATVANAAPIISSFTPTSGVVGSTVTLTGTGLTNTTAVTFTGAAGTPISTTGFLLNGAGTEITSIRVPAGATTGVLRVTTPYGTASTSALAVPNFTVRSAFQLVAASPVRNGLGVGPVKLTFDQVPVAASASGIRLLSRRYKGRRLLGTPVVNGQELTVPLAAGNFLPGETIQVLVPAALESSTGARLNAVTYQFTVATAPAAGAFSPATNYPIGGTPTYLTTADLNEDGLLDLVALASTGCAVRLGLPGGGFGALTTYTVNANSRPLTNGILADLDEDGHLDFVTASGYLPGQVGGSFGPQIDLATHPDARYIAVGDVNNDGRPDILTANPGIATSTVSVLLAQTGGGWGPYVNYGADAGPTSVNLGDVNNDNYPDLIATSSSISNADVSVWLGNGLGGFAARTDYPTGGIPTEVHLADVNEDGRLDLLTSNTGSFSILLGLSTGGFALKRDYASDIFGSLFTLSACLALGDVNGDGHLDAVTAGANPAIWVRLGQGNGLFGAYTAYPSGQLGGLVLGDFTGDSRLDVAGVNRGTENFVVLSGLAATPVLSSIAPASGPLGSTIALTGRNLTGTTAITFAGTTGNLVTTGFTVSTDGQQLTNVVVPAGAATGLVTATTLAGVSNGLLFTVAVPTATRLATGVGQLAVWPNPTTGSFDIALPSSPALARFQEATLVLYTMLGQEVYKAVVPLQSSATGLVATALAPSLKPGLYVLEVQAGAARYRSQLLRQ